MRTDSLPIVMAAALLAAACASPEEALEPEDPSPLAWSIDLPSIELAAGAERTVCFYTTMQLEPGAVIVRWESDVSNGAHGLHVLATEASLQPDGTLSDACVYASPDHLPRLLYQANLSRFASRLPLGTGMALATSQPVIIRLHLINSGDASRSVATQVRVLAAPAGEPLVPVDTFISHRTDLRLAAADRTEVSGACTLPPGTALVRLTTFTLGHATGTEISDDGGALFRSVGGLHAGEVAWRDNPHPIEGPLRYQCHYVNPGDAEILAGGVEGQDELCMMMALVTPAGAPVRCIDDVVVPSTAIPSP